MIKTQEIQAWIDTDYEAMPPMQLALLDAAAKAFTTFGFAAASIDAIASQIGATKGSVYYHYRSKSELFFAVHKRAMVINLRAQLPVLQEKSLSTMAKLFNMCHRHAMAMMESLYYQRVTVQGVELHQSISTTPLEREALREVVAMRDAYEELFEHVLEQGVAEGVFAALDPSIAAKSILGSLNWTTVWYRPREGESEAAKLRIADQLALQAVCGVVAAKFRSKVPTAAARLPA